MKANDTVEYILTHDLYDSAVSLMDDGIREELSNELAPCTHREFLEEYMERHEEKYGSPFIVC